MFKCFFALLLLVGVPAVVGAAGFQFDRIVIEGNRRIATSTIEAVLTVKAGEETTLAAIDANMKAVFALGHFADIDAQERRDGDQSLLVFQVTERPLVRKLEFAGYSELDESKLRALITFRVPSRHDPQAVRESIKAIKAAYVEEGYYASEVSSELNIDERNNATLIMRIDEGPEVKINKIVFEGNTLFDEDDFFDVMETKEGWFLSWLTGSGTYRENVLNGDLERIADLYFNQGYVQVKVKQPLVELDQQRDGLTIYIDIEEGAQFFVEDVGFTGNLMRPVDELQSLSKLRSGDIFSREKLRASLLSMNDLYADEGYAYVNVAPLTKVNPDTRQIELTYDIDPGIQVTVDRINISGNTKTRDRIIRREFTIGEGELFSATKMKESQAQVKNLGFFDEVNLTTAEGATRDLMNIDLAVQERPTGTFSIGAGYSSVDHLIGQGSVTQDNFMGMALKLNLSGAFGSNSTTYQVGLLDPSFLDSDLTIGFDLFKTEREWTEFSKQSTGGALKFGFPVMDKTRAFLTYRYEEKEIFDVADNASFLISEQEGLSTLSSVTASLTRNTTDFRFDPSRGYVSEGTIEFAGLGGTEKFVKYTADYRHYYPAWWETVFSIHGQIGYLQQLGGNEIPIDERFYLGGIRTLRGFNSREVGPRTRTVAVNSLGVQSESYNFIGGTKEAFFNFEYIFPLLKEAGLKGVLFFDAGNAWLSGEEYFSGMRTSVGAGIRWRSPMGPLRLEWGYNLDPKEYEDRARFEFSIGGFY
ncbi:MAG: outer membrane protein assembly factor BamA [Desulfuromonadales bacterium]|nr:outer membrane protein assembly factor BamA [Desulfuromonadales bacterium]